MSSTLAEVEAERKHREAEEHKWDDLVAKVHVHVKDSLTIPKRPGKIFGQWIPPVLQSEDFVTKVCNEVHERIRFVVSDRTDKGKTEMREGLILDEDAHLELFKIILEEKNGLLFYLHDKKSDRHLLLGIPDEDVPPAYHFKPYPQDEAEKKKLDRSLWFLIPPKSWKPEVTQKFVRWYCSKHGSASYEAKKVKDGPGSLYQYYDSLIASFTERSKWTYKCQDRRVRREAELKESRKQRRIEKSMLEEAVVGFGGARPTKPHHFPFSTIFPQKG